jgi:hypothetical protein
MLIKTLIVLMTLTPMNPTFADTYDNIYVTSNIDEHFSEFLAMEISKDFKDSIDEYNKNRNNPKYFENKIQDPKALKLFSTATKKAALPPILQKGESSYYYIEAGKNRIEFNSALFLTKTYYLNGVEKTLKTEDLVASTEIKRNLLSFVIQSAIADDDEDFTAAYKNLDTTKVLMASIIALDSSFKARGILDKIPMMSDVADVNLKNLTAKIDRYQAQCDSSLNLQNNMNNKIASGRWSDMGSLDQYSLMRALRDTADPTYQSTLNLVRKIAAENGNSSYKRDGTLVDTFNIDKKATQCEAMMSSLVDPSSTRTNRLAAYVDGGNSANVAFQKHPCTKITKLKMCLSQFATQASNINDFSRRHAADAKEAGVQIYNVPNNYPTETSSK